MDQEVTFLHSLLRIDIRWEVRKGNLALGQFLNHFKKEYKLNVTGIFHNVQMVDSPTSFLALTHRSMRKLCRVIARESHCGNLEFPLCSLIVSMEKLLNITDGSVEFADLTCSFETLDGKDVVGPAVRYWLKK